MVEITWDNLTLNENAIVELVLSCTSINYPVEDLLLCCKPILSTFSLENKIKLLSHLQKNEMNHQYILDFNDIQILELVTKGFFESNTNPITFSNLFLTDKLIENILCHISPERFYMFKHCHTSWMDVSIALKKFMASYPFMNINKYQMIFKICSLCFDNGAFNDEHDMQDIASQLNPFIHRSNLISDLRYVINNQLDDGKLSSQFIDILLSDFITNYGIYPQYHLDKNKINEWNNNYACLERTIKTLNKLTLLNELKIN